MIVLLLVLIVIFVFVKFQNKDKQINSTARKSWRNWDKNIKENSHLISPFPINEYVFIDDPTTIKDIFENFIFKDNILYGNFGSNLKYILGVSEQHTPSAKNFNSSYERPGASHLWALAAYPDVYKFQISLIDQYDEKLDSLSNKETDILEVLKNENNDLLYEWILLMKKYENEDSKNTYFKFLREQIEFYKRKTEKKLECSK